jgi:hypothetical protein
MDVVDVQEKGRVFVFMPWYIEGIEVWLQLFVTTAQGGSEWSTFLSVRFTP